MMMMEAAKFTVICYLFVCLNNFVFCVKVPVGVFFLEHGII